MLPCIRSACILYSNTCDNHLHRNRPFWMIFAHTNYTTNDSMFSVGYTVLTSYCCSTYTKEKVHFFSPSCVQLRIYEPAMLKSTHWNVKAQPNDSIFFFWFIGRGCVFFRNWTHFEIEHRIFTVRMNQCDDFLFASGNSFKFHNLKSAFVCWSSNKLSSNRNWVECLFAGNVDLFPNCAL